MKYIPALLLFFIACSSPAVKNGVNAGADTVPVKKKSVRNDTTYIIGDLMFKGSVNAKFELLKAGEKPKGLTNGDTLYHDSTITLLGAFRDFGFVYRKFKFRSRFQDYKVKSIYNGKLSRPDFKTDPAARYYRTRIKDGCKDEGVNFAGRYTIVEWGCGCACQVMAAVDRTNGKIIYSPIPFDTLDGHCGLEYYPDSRMIIVNTEALSDHEGYRLEYWRKPGVYVLRNDKFIQIE